MGQVLLMLLATNNYKGEKNTGMLFGSFVLLSHDLKEKLQQNNGKFSY